MSTEFGDERALAAAVGGHDPVTTFTRMERPGTVNIYVQDHVCIGRRAPDTNLGFFLSVLVFQRAG